jgi:hypothetical protein
MLRFVVALCACVTVMPGVALAGPCEDTFVKKGSALGGLKFIASIDVADLAPVSAIGQMHGIAASRGYDILVEEAEDGSMLIEQPMTGKARAFPITVTATQTGKMGNVVLYAKLPTGMLAGEDGAKTEMCTMLAQIKGGKAGLAAAARAKGSVSVSPTLKISSLELSHQVSKDTQRNSAAVPLRYKGKTFTVSGLVDYVIKDGEFFRVAFKIPEPYEEAIRLPNMAPFKTNISCLMAKGQAAYSLTLKPDKTIKLTGTYRDFDEFKHVMWLQDCRPEK